MTIERGTTIVAALFVVVSWPVGAKAELTSITVGAFAPCHDSSSPDLVADPLTASECSDASGIPITFGVATSGAGTVPHYVDVWSATTNNPSCANGGVMGRGNTTTSVCTHLTTIPTSVSIFYGGPTFTLHVTGSELFGDCSVTNTLTYFFFDVTAVGDNSTAFQPGTYQTLTITLDATPPPTPIVTASPIEGDTMLSVPWNVSAFGDLGAAGRVNVYWDPNGGASCSAGDAATCPRVISPMTAPVETVAATSPLPLPTSLLGWSSARHGETGAIAIAAVDGAGNVSPLSSPACVTHVAAVPPSAGCGCGVFGSRAHVIAVAAVLAWVCIARRRR